MQSELDACVFYFREGGDTQGVLAIHVDDILFGGTETFLNTVMEALRKHFPFKDWKVGGGKFPGKRLVQETNGDIRVCLQEYANQVDCIPLTKERRRERERERETAERLRERDGQCVLH